MTLHQLVPLAALALNVALGALALLRNPSARINRVFAAFTFGQALWNGGVFFLRGAVDEPSARTSETVIHAAITVLPAVYYHFVLLVLDAARPFRRSLVVAYALAAAFGVVNLSGTTLLMRGATRTHWGWAPAAGPLYVPFFLFFNAFFIAGLVLLARRYRAVGSSFRRNRMLLVLLGTAIALAGGLVDFVRFLVARVVPGADHVYPVGIPANMVFALMLGTSIVRYRMFDVSAAVKQAAVYVAAGAVAAALVSALLGVLPPLGAGGALGTLPAAMIVAALVTLLASPLGRRVESALGRLVWSCRHGGHETLLALSTRMSRILDSKRLVDTVVDGLVHGIPVTHGALLVRDEDARAFVTARAEATADVESESLTLPDDGAIARWLERGEGVLVVEEATLNPRMAEHFAAARAELEATRAALVVPLVVEDRLTAILLLGEKLSGEIFDGEELDVLSVLANQAATALDNARLYERARRAYEELADAQAQLAQAQKLEAIGRLAGGVAHDFNNLLTIISGRSSLLLDSLRAGDPLRRDVELIETAAERGSGLVRGLLAFSRNQVLQPKVLDLNVLVTGVVPMLRRLIGERIDLVTLPLAPEPRVKTDPGQLEQVIINLAVNARDAMPAGGRLVVRTREVAADDPACAAGALGPGAHVVLEVTDTGIGMDERTRAHVFEPFFTTKALGHGTGLGLAAVYGIVRQSGGYLELDTEPGRGTTFRIYLPQVDEPLEVGIAERASGIVSGGGETLLLVEDEADVLDLARQILEGRGYRVLTAKHGPEALALAARHPQPIHLLLTDVVMPHMSGRELARRLVGERPEIRVLYMLGYADETILPHELLESGARLVQKPFSADHLVRQIRDALDAPSPPAN